ncbi:MAG: OmpA family protein [Treponema sp.]|nr:OmpA family protein [Treponema sp.]
MIRFQYKRCAVGVLVAFWGLSVAVAERAPQYISPNNDGVQDELVIPMRITDKRYIQSWSIVIMNEAGFVVRTIGNKIALPEKVTFKSFFKQLVTPKRGVDVPSAVVWNGVMDNGETAPDGVYTYYVTATDDNGNEGRTDTYTVIVDTQAPDIALRGPADRVFGEGAKSEFSVNQSGSEEDSWTGVFRAADGTVVRTYRWTGRPQPFSWNGTDDNGGFVSDGVYSYEVSATDRAGNVSPPASIQNIIYSAEKPVTAVAVNGTRYFSPGTDSAQGTVTLDITIPVPAARSANRLTRWAVEVVNEKGAVVRRYDGAHDTVPPARIVFDGIDASGARLPDGTYQARVTAQYLNGYETAPLYSPPFVIDTEKPRARTRVSSKVFGAGDKTTLTVTQNTEAKTYAPVDEWTGTIYRADDRTTPVRTFAFGSYPPAQVTWDGFTDAGTLASNGSYVYELFATDRAGNTARIDSETFSLDTSAAQLLLVVRERAFSPNGDGRKDVQTFTPVLQTGIGGVVDYQFVIRDEKGRAVRSSRGTAVPPTLSWDGQSDDGTRCADGQYTAVLTITSANGASAAVTTPPFVLDTVPPSLSLEAAWTIFSPDGVSRRQTIPVTVKDCTKETQWTATVTNSRGSAVRHFSWNGTVQTAGKPEFSWDGADDAGNTAPDGVYTIAIQSEDDAGNRFDAAIRNITLDSRDVRAYITREYDGISPNGDGQLEQQEFAIRTSVPDGIETWEFAVRREDGTVVRRWTQDDSASIPAAITWDGRDTAGSPSEGTFIGVLTAAYKKGNDVRAVSAPFVCTATPPVLTVQTAPEYFSPDNDGTDDELYIRLRAVTKATIARWSFAVHDPMGRPFWQTAGTSSITELMTWDGLSNTQKDAAGRAERVQSAVDYPWTFTVTDTLGMTSTVTGTIPVDVLVIRDGNVLKMAVPSIIFRSDHADFRVETAPGKRDGVTQEQAANNERVLKRIAEVLNKFPDYRVTVVGHANRTTDNEREETEDNPRAWGPALIPLSQSRAVYVRDYLVQHGVAANRLSTQGKGGTEPAVDWHDRENNWKNRRVEFILEK